MAVATIRTIFAQPKAKFALEPLAEVSKAMQSRCPLPVQPLSMYRGVERYSHGQLRVCYQEVLSQWWMSGIQVVSHGVITA